MPNVPNNESPLNNSRGSFASSSGNELTFQFDSNSIHVDIIDGEPCFLAKDICDALGIVNSKDALTRLEGYQKLRSVVATSGQRRDRNFVTESGLYSLIFQSRKEVARIFQKWVTCEVLPSIRKDGYYVANLLKGIGVIELEGREWYSCLRVTRALGVKKFKYGRYMAKYPSHFRQVAESVLISKEYAEIYAAQQVMKQKINKLSDAAAMLASKKEVDHV